MRMSVKTNLLEVAPDPDWSKYEKGTLVERGRIDREKVPQRLVGELGHGVVLDRVPGAEEERTVFAQHTMRFAERPRTVTVEHHAELRGYAVERGRRRAAGSPRRSRASRPLRPARSLAKVDHGGIEIGCENARLLCRRPRAAGASTDWCRQPIRERTSAQGCRFDRRWPGQRFEEHRTEVGRNFPDLTRECNGVVWVVMMKIFTAKLKRPPRADVARKSKELPVRLRPSIRAVPKARVSVELSVGAAEMRSALETRSPRRSLTHWLARADE